MERQNMIWLNGKNSSTQFLALGVEHELVLWEEKGAWEKVRQFLNEHTGQYIFGWFGYDLKNDVEHLESNNPTWLKTPTVYLMIPKHLGKFEDGKQVTLKGETALIGAELDRLKDGKHKESGKATINASISEQDYLTKIEQLKNHIQRGDIYEANFCYEYRGEGEIDSLAVYHELDQKTKAPFAVYANVGSLDIMSVSPERFVCKKGSKLFTQPIKGTIKRGETEQEDIELKEQLRNNPKDRSENIMIVDLVRNDLSRIAEKSSVKVDELCEIYSFENVHQMISTVSAEVKDKHPVDIIKAMFPMGSMTGAPKVRAMELIEEYEESKRGLYSGCIGYFTPEGDFDFNVVIRTILYDNESKRISFSVGGAITDLSTPEGEYEETLLKAKAMKEALPL